MSWQPADEPTCPAPPNSVELMLLPRAHDIGGFQVMPNGLIIAKRSEAHLLSGLRRRLKIAGPWFGRLKVRRRWSPVPQFPRAKAAVRWHRPTWILRRH